MLFGVSRPGLRLLPDDISTSGEAAKSAFAGGFWGVPGAISVAFGSTSTLVGMDACDLATKGAPRLSYGSASVLFGIILSILHTISEIRHLLWLSWARQDSQACISGKAAGISLWASLP